MFMKSCSVAATPMQRKAKGFLLFVLLIYNNSIFT